MDFSLYDRRHDDNEDGPEVSVSLDIPEEQLLDFSWIENTLEIPVEEMEALRIAYLLFCDDTIENRMQYLQMLGRTIYNLAARAHNLDPLEDLPTISFYQEISLN